MTSTSRDKPVVSLKQFDPEEIEPRRKQWTRDECFQLMELGILEEARFELIHGDIIPKMTQHERHIFTCKQVQKALEAVFGEERVRAAAPIAIGVHEEPEPDAAVVIRTGREYLSFGHPRPPKQGSRLKSPTVPSAGI